MQIFAVVQHARGWLYFVEFGADNDLANASDELSPAQAERITVDPATWPEWMPWSTREWCGTQKWRLVRTVAVVRPFGAIAPLPPVQPRN